MIARRGKDFLFAVELCDLLHQHIGIVPSRAIGFGDPACAQVAVAVDQEFHVAGQCARAQQIGLVERSAEQGIAAHDLGRALRDHRERHIRGDSA